MRLRACIHEMDNPALHAQNLVRRVFARNLFLVSDEEIL